MSGNGWKTNGSSIPTAASLHGFPRTRIQIGKDFGNESQKILALKLTSLKKYGENFISLSKTYLFPQNQEHRLIPFLWNISPQWRHHIGEGLLDFPVIVSPRKRLMVAHETAAFINKSMRFVQVIYITGNYCFVPRFSLSHLYMLLCVSFPLNSKNFIFFSQAFFVSWWASICCRFSDRRSWPANRLVLSVWILFFSFLLAVNFSA